MAYCLLCTCNNTVVKSRINRAEKITKEPSLREKLNFLFLRGGFVQPNKSHHSFIVTRLASCNYRDGKNKWAINKGGGRDMKYMTLRNDHMVHNRTCFNKIQTRDVKRMRRKYHSYPTYENVVRRMFTQFSVLQVQSRQSLGLLFDKCSYKKRAFIVVGSVWCEVRIFGAGLHD